ESSVGAYPIETVKTMSKIVVAAEQELLSRGLQQLVPGTKPRTQHRVHTSSQTYATPTICTYAALRHPPQKSTVS
ncbi:hypothetical protein, partial [[Kitasatospora] papulosa]|uniref:hypothetical protein n=1 Tax=[Kitasatospora] papulosa TaxID=1464011 RepID=UPI003624B591